MQVGAFTQYIDVAQVVLYVFWIFFALLVLYLHRESKREGYPLRSDRSKHIKVQGYPAIPEPKTYLLPHGGTLQLPNDRSDDARELKATPIGRWEGAPLVPDGDALVDGLGAAAWADRADTPDLNSEGEPRLRPLSMLGDAWRIAPFDTNPVGLDVRALDKVVVGQVTDVLVDQMEFLPRYYQVTLTSGRQVLVPMMLCKLKKKRKASSDGSIYDRMVIRREKELHVVSINSDQFERVPVTASADQVTLLEEDKVQAYFGGGHVYASRRRTEPLI